MCFGATCPTCCKTQPTCAIHRDHLTNPPSPPPAKKSWRGCGNHIPQALDGVPESQWCTCGPRTKVGGKEYPPAAKFEMPGVSWLTSMFGGGAKGGKGKEDL